LDSLQNAIFGYRSNKIAMNKEKRPYVCPAELAGSLDNSIRRLVHKPGKILEAYIRKEMTVLDLGCGPGYFTIELAKLVGDGGKVIAADLQQGMLDKVRVKIRGTALEQIVEIHKCQDDKIGITHNVDFVLAFWMVHEVLDQDRLFGELKSYLKSDGNIFIIEPKFHVPLKSFESLIALTERMGFHIIEIPKVAFSRAILLKPDLPG
jgi:ubiquinone/menaquinone biosynthesis C-methylase UbiE